MMHIENFFGGPLFEFNVDLCADVCFYPRDDCLSASVCTRALYVLRLPLAWLPFCPYSLILAN
jgi:hypothetical protein